MHSAGGAQPLGDGDVPLRPRAPLVSGCESSPERSAVTTPELPINPAKADRLVECLVVGERCWVCSALLGKDEPHSLRLGLVASQPGPPFGSISDQQLWKIHGVTVSPLCRIHPDLESKRQLFSRQPKHNIWWVAQEKGQPFEFARMSARIRVWRHGRPGAEQQALSWHIGVVRQFVGRLARRVLQEHLSLVDWLPH